MKIEKPIALINVVSQLGAGRSAHGIAWRSRMDYLRGYLENNGLPVAEIITIEEPGAAEKGDASMKYLDAVADVCGRVGRAVKECHTNQVVPVCIGGDHSLSVGSVGATAAILQKSHHDLGLLWIDAHMDMNTTRTTPSGNIHGMALATIVGAGHPLLVNTVSNGGKVQRRHAAVIGARFADKSELLNLEHEGPRVITMRDVDRTGLAVVLRDILSMVVSTTGGLHLSFDLDVLDPSCAPAVNTPFPGGMTFREARLVCETAAATGQVISMDLVEHNPEKGGDEVMLPIMGEIIACTLGASAMP